MREGAMECERKRIERPTSLLPKGALQMPRNPNAGAFPKGMTDSDFPQKLAPLDPSECDKMALLRFQKKRDHVSKPDCGYVAEFPFGGLLGAAIEIASERRALLGAIKVALGRRDHTEVIRLASKLCGATDEKSSGANSGVHGRPGV
jgi:hypothetical protein